MLRDLSNVYQINTKRRPNYYRKIVSAKDVQIMDQVVVAGVSFVVHNTTSVSVRVTLYGKTDDGSHIILTFPRDKKIKVYRKA